MLRVLVYHRESALLLGVTSQQKKNATGRRMKKKWKRRMKKRKERR